MSNYSKQSIHSHLSALSDCGSFEQDGVLGSVGSYAIRFFYAIYRKEVSAISELLINEEITEKELRVIGSHGEQIGIMELSAALQKAEEEELDLVLIAPSAKPPVAKIIDYSKYRYEMLRKEKDAKKKQKVIELKEVRLSPNIEENDLATKAGAARKFLEKGNKVKVSLRFRGREMSHMTQTKHVLDDFAAQLSDIAVIDKPSKMEGRSLVIILTKKSN